MSFQIDWANPPSLSALGRQYILATLHAVGGNKSEAARRCGITLRTLYNKLSEYGVAEYYVRSRKRPVRGP